MESIVETEIPEDVLAKESALKALLASYKRLAIAYSGGVDSSYLAEIAHETLGHDAHMILADSPSIPRSEVRDAVDLAEEKGWRLSLIPTTEFEQEEFLKNDGTRCYFCKNELFTRMDQYARENHIAILAYGEIADDLLDPTRLGAKAAREHQVVAPLSQVGLEKEEIRRLSRARKLPTWNKASFACLSSRFPKGTRVNIQAMQQVEKAEEALKQFGFYQYRARHHGEICRIEVDPGDFNKLLDPQVRETLTREIKAAGYRFVTLDLSGYRMGSTAGLPENTTM